MSYCFNPSCPHPQNVSERTFCSSCGNSLQLKDRYYATKIIGSGGFGKTYLAVDEADNSPCVIKQFSFPSSSSTALRLFSDEAGQLKSLGSHKQIPTFIDYVEQQDECFIIQEFIDGSNLEEELVANSAFSEIQVEHLLLDILPVIEFIHERGVIHRDIKPENIIHRKGDGKFVLVDFGAAKQATTTALAKTGTTIGSAGYTAPEQAFGKAVKQSDLYSLGVTCVHLLTGMHPFDLVDSADGNWVWRDYLKHPVSQKLGKVIDKLLERGTRQRYQSATEVLQDLQLVETYTVAARALSKEVVELYAQSIVEQQSIRRFRGWKVIVISLLVVGGVGTIPVVTGILNQPRVAPILHEQIRKAPAQAKPTPQVLPQDETHIDLISTLVDMGKAIALLEVLLGACVIFQAARRDEDISPGIGMVVFGVILTLVINAAPSLVASVDAIGTNNKSTSFNRQVTQELLAC